MRELRAYLACGQLEQGFIRCYCNGCGSSLLVPFSCGGRSICPSCAARRMCNTAAHLVDRVIPNVPIRQWVVSLPWELRPLVARHAEILSAAARIAVECVLRELGRASGEDEPLAGAVCFVHRAGGSLNLNPHLHIVALDGVLVRGPSELRFVEADAPTPTMLETVLQRLRRRIIGWLRRHGHLEERGFEDRSNETPAQTALDGCLRIGFSKGALVQASPGAQGPAPDPESEADEQAFEPRRKTRYAVELDGFNLHAAVRVRADNDVGRERLLRYCARPSVSLERLSLRPDGLVAYRVRHSRRGETHRVMAPLELMARLAALVPPPRHPLVRYFGVLSSRSKWRSFVVPRVDQAAPLLSWRCAGHGARGAAKCQRADASPPAVRDARQQPTGNRPVSANAPSFILPAHGSASPPSASTSGAGRPASPSASGAPGVTTRSAPGHRTAAFERHAFNVISVLHLERLLGGELLATGPRLDWARLLRRTYGFEPLDCPHCGGRLRPLAEITDSTVVAQILDAVGWERRTPPRARSPAHTAEAPAPPLI